MTDGKNWRADGSVRDCDATLHVEKPAEALGAVNEATRRAALSPAYVKLPPATSWPLNGLRVRALTASFVPRPATPMRFQGEVTPVVDTKPLASVAASTAGEGRAGKIKGKKEEERYGQACW